MRKIQVTVICYEKKKENQTGKELICLYTTPLPHDHAA